MEIWQFWLSIAIIFCLLGVILAILIKKHKDKHKIVALQKNLEDLEKSFKFLKEDIEFATEKSLTNLEEKSTRIKEFLTIADNKCLYANSLLKEIEQETEILKELNASGGNNIINSSADKQKLLASVNEKIEVIAAELREDIKNINNHLGYLNNRVIKLESQPLEGDTSTISQIDDYSKEELKSEILDLKIKIKELENSISERVTDEISKQLGTLTGLAEIPIDSGKVEEASIIDTSTIIDASISSLPDNVEKNFPQNDKKDNSKVEYYPKGKELIAQEIMECYEQGISIPEIADKLKLSRTEIDLIIKINKQMNSVDKAESYGN